MKNDFRNVRRCQFLYFLTKYEINIFADITVLIISGDNKYDLKSLANWKLAKLHEYLTADGIKLNHNKSQYMITQSKSNNEDDML